MKNYPLITVIIPLYNGEKYIRRSIESVLAQTYTNYELIVVDDGSTDSGSEVVQNIYDPRLHLVQQINLGVSAARNKGIAEGKGKYFAFLDADDEWDINFLEAMVNLSYIYPLAGIYASGYRLLFQNRQGIEITAAESKKQIRTVLITDYFYRLNHAGIILASGVMIPGYIFDKLGSFNISETYEEDEEMWIRIAYRYHIAYDTRILFSYYQTGCTNKPRFNVSQQYSPTVKTMERLLLENYGHLHSDNVLITRINKVIQYHINLFILRNKRSAALKYLENSKMSYTMPLTYKLIKIKLFWPFIYIGVLSIKAIKYIKNRFIRNILRRDIVLGGTLTRCIKT